MHERALSHQIENSVGVIWRDLHRGLTFMIATAQLNPATPSWSVEKKSFFIYLPLTNSVIAGIMTMTTGDAGAALVIGLALRIWLLFLTAYALLLIQAVLLQRAVASVKSYLRFALYCTSIAAAALTVDKLIGLPFRLTEVLSPSYGAPFLLTVQLVALLAYRQAVADRQTSLEQVNSRQEAELKLIRGQNNPHFLFNTLNLIISTIPEDPELSQELLHDLSSYLRKTVTASQEKLSTVEEEIQLSKAYLNIMSQRFAGRLSYSVSMPYACAGIAIPPLIFQSVIENAVKFGVAKHSGESRIALSISRVDKQLTIEICNDGATGISSASTESMGLRITEAVLQSEYGDDYELNVTTLGNTYTVAFLLPIRSGS